MSILPKKIYNEICKDEIYKQILASVNDNESIVNSNIYLRRSKIGMPPVLRDILQDLDNPDYIDSGIYLGRQEENSITLSSDGTLMIKDKDGLRPLSSKDNNIHTDCKHCGAPAQKHKCIYCGCNL